jgi:predicted nucleic acid-binding Zn ribbon protein
MNPILYKNAKEKEKHTHCAISLESFQEEDKIIQLECNHCFLIEPILQWITEGLHCPVCRKTIEKRKRDETKMYKEFHIVLQQGTKYKVFTLWFEEE